MNRALALLASLVLPDGQLWGEAAQPFQIGAARQILDPSPDEPPYRFETRPRGGSKSSDAAGIAVADLCEMAPPRSRSYCVASDAEQSGIILDKIGGFLERTPDLGSALKLEARRVVHRLTGASLSVIAADEASAYGLTPRMVIADELSVWPSTRNARGLWAAMVSALPKTPGSKLLVISSAGDPAHWSYKVLDEARTSPHWRVAEIPGPVPWIDPRDLVAQRSLLLPSQYARLHENIWVEGEDRLVSADALKDAVQLAGPQQPRSDLSYVAGVDVGLRHDATAIAIAHAEPIEVPILDPRRGEPARPPQRVVLDRLIVMKPPRGGEVQLSAIEDALLQAHAMYRLDRIVFDPWQAVGLQQRLRDRGLECEEFTFTARSNGHLTATLYNLLSDRMLALPEDADLLDELSNIRLRESSPGMAPRMDHDAGRHNDRVIALALAAHTLMAKPIEHLRIYQIRDKRLSFRNPRSAPAYEPPEKFPGGERQEIAVRLERIRARDMRGR